MARATLGRSSGRRASRSTRDALFSTVAHWSCGTPFCVRTATVCAVICASTLAAVAFGSMSYVAGNSQPSALPLASAGRPIAAGSAIAALTSSIGMAIFSLIFVAIWSRVSPSGIVES